MPVQLAKRHSNTNGDTQEAPHRHGRAEKRAA